MRISRPSDLMGRHLLLVTLVMGLTFAGFAALGLQVVRESTDRTLEERRVIAQLTANRLDDLLQRNLTSWSSRGSTCASGSCGV
jgi:hypothetical protein